MKRYFFCLTVILASVGYSHAQEVDKSDTAIYTVVEVMPEYPGGNDAMLSFLAHNIKYPKEARIKHLSGRVFINFFIDKDGKVSGARVLRGFDKECDEEALRVVNSMPAWKPGTQNKKPVRVYFNLPINFRPN